MHFKDDKGNILYGYSQKNLELVYTELKIIKYLFLIAIILIIYVLVMFHKYHFMTLLINAISSA